MSAWGRNSNMLVLRNQFSKFFEKVHAMTLLIKIAHTKMDSRVSSDSVKVNCKSCFWVYRQRKKIKSHVISKFSSFFFKLISKWKFYHKIFKRTFKGKDLIQSNYCHFKYVAENILSDFSTRPLNHFKFW